MRTYRLISLFLILMVLATPTLAQPLPQEDGWTPVAEGIDYQEFRLQGPNHAFVARMDRSNTNLTIESSIAHGGLYGSLETVRDMADEAEQAINYWGSTFITPTWGARNDVVVAINGSYFDFDTKIMTGGMIKSGWYAKRFEECGGYTGFGWNLSRVPFIGENVVYSTGKNIAMFPAMETEMDIFTLNGERNPDELVLYTPQYAENTGTNNNGVEVLVELTRPAMLLPEPSVYAKGFVRAINIRDGKTTIPFDHVVLSASGELSATLLANVSLGAEVRISQELTSRKTEDCGTPPKPDISWIKTYASVQGHYYFVKNGIINPYDDDQNAVDLHPRTAIAYNDQYIFFIVVDGRDPLVSIGMSIGELGDFALNMLGATYAVAQDGGGSSTMVVNGVVMNNVYCNNVFCIYENRVNIPLVTKNTTPKLLYEQSLNRKPAYAGDYERWVPNGMMMVKVEPAAFTSTFTVTQQVTLTATTNVFTGPGNNFHHLVDLPAGTQGEIIDSLSELNGVWARDAYWWRVDFGAGVIGWVQETQLSAR
jgi:hypothetical protein